jgi:alkylhydroperoxidase family enzyme
MTWIETLDESQHPIIREIAEYRKGTHGYFPNVLQAMSLKPETLRRLLQFQERMTFGGSSLGRRWEELISFRVSALNTCTY